MSTTSVLRRQQLVAAAGRQIVNQQRRPVAASAVEQAANADLVEAAWKDGRIPGNLVEHWLSNLDSKSGAQLVEARADLARRTRRPRPTAAPAASRPAAAATPPPVARGDVVLRYPDGREVPVSAGAAAVSAPRPVAASTSGGGALPPFTASGVDPQHLLRLPASERAVAAAMSDRGQVLAMIQSHEAFEQTGVVSKADGIDTSWVNDVWPTG
jgi:hypothetical protein